MSYSNCTEMKVKLPPGWEHVDDSSVLHCYEKRIDDTLTYRCYIFTSNEMLRPFRHAKIKGYGVRKGGEWIIPRIFPESIPYSPKKIQSILTDLINRIFLYEI